MVSKKDVDTLVLMLKSKYDLDVTDSSRSPNSDDISIGLKATGVKAIISQSISTPGLKDSQIPLWACFYEPDFGKSDAETVEKILADISEGITGLGFRADKDSGTIRDRPQTPDSPESK